MSTSALLACFEAWRARGDALVLATVVETEGSTYTKAGHRILINRAGDYQGLVSGGCLEGDLASHAQRVLATGRPQLISYDLRTTPDDEVFGLAVGCQGLLRIFLQPLLPGEDYAPMNRLAGVLRGDEPGVCELVIDGPDAGTTRIHTGPDLAGLPGMPAPTTTTTVRLALRPLPRLRLLPVIVFLAVLMFGMRLGDVVDNLNALSAGAPAVAQDRGRAPETAAAPDAAPAAPPDAAAAAGAAPAASSAPDPAAADPSGGRDTPRLIDPATATETELALLQDLSARRTALDQRERALTERGALLAVAEQRLDQKMAELAALRSRIEAMLGQLDEQREEQVLSLVRIYEAMRPADAAAIFNGLDMDVMIGVLQRMREQKAAPILAAMDPVRARTVTAELAQRRSLPELPTLPN